MADFRKWITALALLVLFAGLAGAQGAGSASAQLMSCTTTGIVPTLRAEGVTELVGDIYISCTGGTPPTPMGTQIPQANLVVNMSTQVTSKVASNGLSEAMLLIDEPGTDTSNQYNGFGISSPMILCTSTTSCPVYVADTTKVTPAPVPGIAIYGAGTQAGAPSFNAFLGTVNGSTITFAGIPILAPGTAGITRTFRITNVRVPASGASSASVTASVQIFGSAVPLSISNPSVTVGIINTSLTPSVTNAAGKAIPANAVTAFTQCNSTLGSVSTAGAAAMLNFAETFPNAFKTRVSYGAASTSFLATSAAGSFTQNVPGTLYNSESGLITDLPIGATGHFAVGLADSGTRFKATFANLPSGATVYVSRYNVSSFSTTAVPAGTIGTSAITTPVAGYTTAAAGAYTPPTAPTGGFKNVGGGIDVVALSGTNPTAVWEVLNANPFVTETYKFAVYVAYTPSGNAPEVGGSPTVTLSYAPIDPTDSTTAIPRFTAGPASTAQPLLSITNCQTVLLFPYVVTAAGFDTGIAISNTSKDPLGTATSTGSCTLSFYGANAPTPPTSCVSGDPTCMGPIAGGGETAILASSVATNFSGYVFAVCNFQYAHGFAYITNAASSAQGSTTAGYLALVINSGNVARSVGSNAFVGEGLGQ